MNLDYDVKNWKLIAMLAKTRNFFRRILNNSIERREWVRNELKRVEPGKKLLDAGCGEQQYREYCDHLDYVSQDVGQYAGTDESSTASLASAAGSWDFGELDYQCDIWDIPASDNSFDAILCTEVLEHLPRPSEAIEEFSRLLKSGGKLILTVPSHSLRHQDPYYYSAGYSDHYLKYWLDTTEFKDIKVTPKGDYYSWLFCEVHRCMRAGNILEKFILLPSFFYYLYKLRSPSEKAINTLGFGYHVTATKF